MVSDHDLLVSKELWPEELETPGVVTSETVSISLDLHGNNVILSKLDLETCRHTLSDHLSIETLSRSDLTKMVHFWRFWENPIPERLET